MGGGPLYCCHLFPFFSLFSSLFFSYSLFPLSCLFSSVLFAPVIGSKPISDVSKKRIFNPIYTKKPIRDMVLIETIQAIIRILDQYQILKRSKYVWVFMRSSLHPLQSLLAIDQNTRKIGLKDFSKTKGKIQIQR